MRSAPPLAFIPADRSCSSQLRPASPLVVQVVNDLLPMAPAGRLYRRKPCSANLLYFVIPKLPTFSGGRRGSTGCHAKFLGKEARRIDFSVHSALPCI